jgi:hypothetical protein
MIFANLDKCLLSLTQNYDFDGQTGIPKEKSSSFYIGGNLRKRANFFAVGPFFVRVIETASNDLEIKIVFRPGHRSGNRSLGSRKGDPDSLKDLGTGANRLFYEGGSQACPLSRKTPTR